LKQIREVLVVAALALATLPAASRAETLAEPPEALKQLSLDELFDLEVTSVSQKPEPVSKTAAAVHVVTADDLRRMGVVRIPEAGATGSEASEAPATAGPSARRPSSASTARIMTADPRCVRTATKRAMHPGCGKGAFGPIGLRLRPTASPSKGISTGAPSING